MALTQDQIDYLREHQVDPAVVDSLNGLKDIASGIEQEGRERKEADEEEVVEEEVQEEPTPEFVTREEAGKAIGDTVLPMIEAIKAMNERLSSLEASIKEMTVANTSAIDRAASVTPAASLKELIAQSIIGSPDAQVDGRTSLAKSGPREASSSEIIDGLGELPFLSGLISSSYGG